MVCTVSIPLLLFIKQRLDANRTPLIIGILLLGSGSLKSLLRFILESHISIVMPFVDKHSNIVAFAKLFPCVVQPAKMLILCSPVTCYLRRHRAHYDVMQYLSVSNTSICNAFRQTWFIHPCPPVLFYHDRESFSIFPLVLLHICCLRCCIAPPALEHAITAWGSLSNSVANTDMWNDTIC